ncbi:hypothetical protein FQN51_004497 [Onygenales sp. PD_10]|nr:hypothetical protein FQN51_004497 [Onygenales sp. PD_10]
MFFSGLNLPHQANGLQLPAFQCVLITLCLLQLPFQAIALPRNLPRALDKAGNPVIEGWYADPEARIYDNKYFIYPTVSAEFDDQTYFEAFSSHDLITWKNVGRILDFKDVPWSTNRAAWAPSVGHKNGNYYLYFSAGDGAGIGVAKSEDPEGPFVDALGKPLIGDVKFGAQPIDAQIFIDDDGRNYLYFGGWSHCVVVELDDDMVSFKGDFVEVTPPDYTEGSWMLKRDGIYYFMYSVGGWTDNTYGVSYVTAKSPLGPFNGPAKKILSGDPNIGTGAGHHSVFNVGDDYYITYHRRFPNDSARDHRSVCIDRMHFNDDGEIEVVQITTDGVDERVLE